MDDTSSGLSADGRITLRTALGNPQHFAAVILQHFYELQLLLQLFDTKQHVDDAYSYYGTFFTNSSQYPCLQSRWIEIRDQKRTFRQMVRRIVDEGFWRRAVIHRVTNVEDDSLKEKKIVLDPTDAARFPLTHFTHIFSNTSYIVDSSSSQVEFHLFVSVDCPLTDDELRDIISKPGDEDNSYVKELWFRGAHVFNLDSIRQIREWMDAMAPTLMDNVSCRRHVVQSCKREEKADAAKKDGSRMVTTGYNVDQNGHLRQARKFLDTEEVARYDLMQSCDQVLDGVVFVSALPFIVTHFSSRRQSFRLYFIIGRSMHLSIMSSHRVCFLPFLCADAAC